MGTPGARGIPPGITATPGSAVAEIWERGGFGAARRRPSGLHATYRPPALRTPSLSVDLRQVQGGYVGAARVYDPSRNPALQERLLEKHRLSLEYGIAAAQLLAVKRAAQEAGEPRSFILSQEAETDIYFEAGDGEPFPASVEPSPFSLYHELAEQLGWRHGREVEGRRHSLAILIPPDGFDATRWLA